MPLNFDLIRDESRICVRFCRRILLRSVIARYKLPIFFANKKKTPRLHRYRRYQSTNYNSTKFTNKQNGEDTKELAASTKEKEADIEGKEQKLPYPRSIPFIVSNEFCERFNYYGMRTILVLYLTRKLMYDDNTATIMYHTFTTGVYFMCIFGAIISDSWLGKFRTILYLSIVYAIGSIVISLGAIPPLTLPGREMTILGLVLIAVGSGGIKPCVAAFGGDQFKMPQQAAQMATFFSIFYFAINSGSLISTTITPILRQDVQCFDQLDCYSLAFGVPGMLMIVSIVIFVVGKFLYVNRPTSGNMVVLVSKCIGNAVSTRMKEKKTNPKNHWLDYSTEKYGQQLVNDTKILLKVLLLYIPLPFFWALFDQQGSRWTFQATRMDGELGATDVKPDQMQLVNPLLILLFIPLYDVLFYPLLSKIGVRRPLQKLALGGIFAGVAFLCSAIVELQLEKTYAVLPVAGECQLRVFNTYPCDYNIQTNIPSYENIHLKSFEMFGEHIVNVDDIKIYEYTMTPTTAECAIIKGVFNLKSKTAMSYFGANRDAVMREYEDNPDKSRTGDPLLRILVNSQTEQTIVVADTKSNGAVRYTNASTVINRVELVSSIYDITVGTNKIEGIQIRQGSVSTLIVNNGKYQIFEITQANSVHMFWLIPQYVILTLGEVMFSVTGLQFSYAQAPDSMKSVLQACWQLTVAFGNLIDVIIVSIDAMESQSGEFFLFAGLMFLDMGLFMYLAYRFKSVKQEEDERKQQEIVPLASSEDGRKVTGMDNIAFKTDD